MILNSILIFFLSALFKWLLVRKSNIDFDTFGHLYFIKELKKQGGGPWSKLKIQCWEGKLFSHPFLLHSLLSLLPFDFLFKYQKVVNLIFDSLFCVYIYITAILLFNDQKSAIYCVFIYLFTPIWFSKISMGPRVNNFTPRLFTEIVFNILACILVGIYKIEGIELCLITISLAAIIILTSKFGLQMVLFSLPLMSLFLQSLYPVILLFATLIVTIIISKGSVISLFKSQIKHLIDYFNANLKRNTSISNRNQFIKINKSDLFSVLGIRKLIYNYFFYNSHTVIFFKMPIFILFGYLSLRYFFLLNGVFLNMYLITLAVFIIYLIVSIRVFLFLGEAERYLNHIAIIIIFCSVKLLVDSGMIWLMYLIVFYGILFYLIELIYYNKFLKNKVKEVADKEIEDTLNSFTDERIILSYPYHNFNVFRVMLNTKHKVIFPIHMSDEFRNSFILNFEKNYSYINLNKLDEVAQLTNCSVVILYDPDSIKENFQSAMFTSKWIEIKLENSIYKLFIRNGI